MIRRLLLSQAWIEDQCGQGLVELALVGLALTFILAGVLDLGRAYFAYIAVADAAAEGAAYGAMVNPCDPSDEEVIEEIKDRVAKASGGLVCIDRDLVVVDCDAETITVTVTYSHTLLTPFIQALVGGDTLALRQWAAQQILD